MTDAQIRNRIDRVLAEQLRATIYGNLASLHTGSVLHQFEFAELQNTIAGGTFLLRLRTFDANETFVEDFRRFLIGEVADGAQPQIISSSDGISTLKVPALAVPGGLAALAIEPVCDLPDGGKIYRLLPDGMHLTAPVSVTVQSSEHNMLFAALSDGNVITLTTTKEQDILTGLIPDIHEVRGYWAGTIGDSQSRTRAADQVPSLPWPDGEPLTWEAGAIGGLQDGIALEGPIDISEAQTLMIAATVTRSDNLMIVVRHDAGAAVFPLSSALADMSEAFLEPSLRVKANSAPQATRQPSRCR